jgi:fructokinase
VFGVIAGTGCGGGVVIDGRILTGRNRIAGEWGHIPIDPNGAPCFCGARGCVETFVSGPGIASQYAALTGQTQSAEQVVARWQQGEYVARDVMERVFSAFGRGLAAVAGILDPDIIVLGGGLSNVPGLCERVRESLVRDVFSDTCDTPVVRHHLGDSAGVIGAALIGDERPSA